MIRLVRAAAVLPLAVYAATITAARMPNTVALATHRAFTP